MPMKPGPWVGSARKNGDYMSEVLERMIEKN